MGAAIFAWVAEEPNRILGQVFSGGEEKLNVDMVRDAKDRGLNAWKHFKVANPKLLWIPGGRPPG